jgi:deoxyribodipyrimidine photo-lyase
MQTAILWFRNDLRLSDNPALHRAVAFGAVVPVFIWAPEEEGAWPPGAASRWWLHQSLRALDASLRARGSRLILRFGPTMETLRDLIQQTGARAVCFNRRHEPDIEKRDSAIIASLESLGIEVQTFNSHLFNEPRDIVNKSGSPFRVFTPYWKTCLASMRPSPPERAPDSWVSPDLWPASLELAALGLESKIDWAGGFRAAWTPGEVGAQAALARFRSQALGGYAADRDFPAMTGTSRLSPHLHFGEILPRQIWDAASRAKGSDGFERFAAELGWREFAHHLLSNYPHTPSEPLRPEFASMPWRDDAEAFNAWRRGQTGYPIVDAGMRELWATGWMHNRVRMVVASFLTKDLLQSWSKGARWFWDTLVDADLASNTLGWQWCAGCGADAMPYFRIFNPVAQGVKFDPNGDYTRRWVPELARLPNKWVHQPWRAPAAVLQTAGVRLGADYPEPIVPHEIARNLALEAFHQLRQS